MSVVQRWRREAKRRPGALNPDFFVHRRYDSEERLPWDFIDHGGEQTLSVGRMAQGGIGTANAAV